MTSLGPEAARGPGRLGQEQNSRLAVPTCGGLRLPDIHTTDPESARRRPPRKRSETSQPGDSRLQAPPVLGASPWHLHSRPTPESLRPPHLSNGGPAPRPHRKTPIAWKCQPRDCCFLLKGRYRIQVAPTWRGCRTGNCQPFAGNEHNPVRVCVMYAEPALTPRGRANAAGSLGR